MSEVGYLGSNQVFGTIASSQAWIQPFGGRALGTVIRYHT